MIRIVYSILPMCICGQVSPVAPDHPLRVCKTVYVFKTQQA